MDYTDSKDTGYGSFHPVDASQYAEIVITVENGITSNAVFETNDDTVSRCAEAVCRLIVGFPTADILQMNNKAVYFNIDETLPLDKLFSATIAVNAAKKASIDYLKKNVLPVPNEQICNCLK